MLQNSPLYAYIPAKDVSRARKFYEGTLGFKPKQETAGGVIYEFAKGTACFLYPTPNAGTSQASQAFWQGDDLEREMAELKARGVTLKSTICRVWTRTAFRRPEAPKLPGSRTPKEILWR